MTVMQIPKSLMPMVAKLLGSEPVKAQGQPVRFTDVKAKKRHLAQQCQAENAAAATAVYDSCFGPGSFAADTQKRN